MLTVKAYPRVLKGRAGDYNNLFQREEVAYEAVSPGIGFGEYGEGFVRFALVENEARTKQAVKGIGKVLK